jgi:serine/threonine protein kinase
MQKSTSFTYQNMIKYISSGVMEDSYEILELLGQGTFSEVFKGKNRQTGNIRAIKKIDRKKHSKIEPLLLN